MLIALLLICDPVIGWSADGEKFRFGYTQGGYCDEDAVWACPVDGQLHDVSMDAVAGKRSEVETEIQEYSEYLAYAKATKLALPARAFKGMTAYVEELSQSLTGDSLCGTLDRKLKLEVREGTQVLSTMIVPFARTVEPYFSPDGMRIAWVLGFSDGEAFILPTQGQLLSITASKQDQAGARKLARDLDKQGFITTRMTIAKKDRDKTVVYAQPSAMKEAQALAAIMKATVEPINWDTKAQVVLALAKGWTK